VRIECENAKNIAINRFFRQEHIMFSTFRIHNPPPTSHWRVVSEELHFLKFNLIVVKIPTLNSFFFTVAGGDTGCTS
jgi:exoribonuclease R